MIDGIDGNYNNIYLVYSALCKSIEWSYENEWRLIFAHGLVKDDSLYKIGPPMAIYLGSKISEQNTKIIFDIALEKKVSVYKMSLSETKYSMEPYLLTV